MEHKGNLFLKEINGFMLNVTDWCVISPATGEGAFLPSWTLYMCFFFMTWKRGTRLLCSLQQESWKTFFPPFPPVLLHFHLPDGGCVLTFAGTNLLVYLDFPSSISLNEINGHSCGQIYPKLQLSSLGIPANKAHPKQDSTHSNNRLNNTVDFR